MPSATFTRHQLTLRFDDCCLDFGRDGPDDFRLSDLTTVSVRISTTIRPSSAARETAGRR